VSVEDLAVMYGVAGVGCAIAVLRKDAARGAWAVVSALVTVVLWPLWAPFVLASPTPVGRANPVHDRDDESADVSAGQDAAVRRIERALEDSVKAVQGTPMSELFSQKVSQRIAAEVRVVSARIGELITLTAAEGLDSRLSAARLATLEEEGAPARTIATARLQHESVAKLEELRQSDERALCELADLLEALRAQLLLARYAGSPSEGTGAIVNEVWARLEGLGVALETPA
jgi:hypothetical protein